MRLGEHRIHVLVENIFPIGDQTNHFPLCEPGPYNINRDIMGLKRIYNNYKILNYLTLLNINWLGVMFRAFLYMAQIPGH